MCCECGCLGRGLQHSHVIPHACHQKVTACQQDLEDQRAFEIRAFSLKVNSAVVQPAFLIVALELVGS